MKRQEPELDDCGQCLKYVMFSMNFVFFLFAGTIMGLGIWIIVDRNFMSAILGTELMTVAAWLIIIGGGVVFILSFLGCVGALLESKPLLIIYATFLLLGFLGLLVSGVISVIYRSTLREDVREFMRERLQKDYGVNLSNRYNRFITDAWDDAQKTLYCCAVEEQGWVVYKSSEWYKIQPGVPETDRPLVPNSCCERDQYGHYIDLQKCRIWPHGPPSHTGGQLNEALHYRGCFTAGYDFVMEYAGYLIAMAISVAVILIAGIIFSLMLIRMV